MGSVVNGEPLVGMAYARDGPRIAVGGPHAMLDAIRHAKRSITFETFIHWKGPR